MLVCTHLDAVLEEDAERREDDGEDDAHHRHRVVRHRTSSSQPRGGGGGGGRSLTDRLAGEEGVLEQPGRARAREEPRGGEGRAVHGWAQDKRKQNWEPVLVGACALSGTCG